MLRVQRRSRSFPCGAEQLVCASTCTDTTFVCWHKLEFSRGTSPQVGSGCETPRMTRHEPTPATAEPDDLTDLGAVELSALIHSGQVSSREVMAAYLARIHAINPLANALVNLADDEVLLKQADECDVELAAGFSRGWLHGIPQAIKDLNDASGYPTTSGSPLLATFRPGADGLLAERMRSAGCIVIGKTNVPEFGLGSHTFNPVFGPTPNAYSEGHSAGGSSGGAASALAHRLLPVADGSDYGGSLRNPAAWNNIFGFRPSQGRVPDWPSTEGWIRNVATDGPMGRSVADVAALLATQAGWDPRDPLSIPEPTNSSFFGDRTSVDPSELKIGWLGDLGGHLPTDPGVLDACLSGLRRFEAAGAAIEPVALDIDLDAVWTAWITIRWVLVGHGLTAVIEQDAGRGLIKPEAMWEFERSRSITATDLMQASTVRSALLQVMLGLFKRYDLLVLPTAQVWPFPIAERWPASIAGRSMDTYHRWMETVLYATFCGLPAISVPVGFGGPNPARPLPMGMQLIGPSRADASVLAAAAAYEQLIPDLLAIRP